ncbi:DsbE family thiol:disulfide interchange protein [Marinibactrum halimedae]|uniref:Thiol:disulfide interchange protein DsbE n=1 Tax=Marinibactrum halimedae TaxID=1444977 RepID=A0AA37T9W0_9GAMM|nr:DsbE family thiol:disulfide interchange protein [Marinibactrum halimedae]MCD9460393.1 DsbE family thiol:disulfide interchange protein [Marinibactrum halimedae]GLS27478.1 thiol:disulfide interchange protein DsbE [Marinibactrum halimedae]
MKRLKLFIPFAIFAVLAILFYRGLSLDPTHMPSALLDKPVPAFSLPKLKAPSSLVTEKELLGEPYLLNVWGSWCVTCRVEHPYLLELANNGVNIYGVNYKDDTTEAVNWLAQLGDPYKFSIVDEEGRLGIDLGVFGAPETYIVDRKGVVRYKHVGMVSDQVWQETLAPIYRSLL